MPHRLSRALTVGAALLSLSCLMGCKEKIDPSARYVFTKRTVMDYLESHPAYSDYAALLRQVPVSPLSRSTVGQLLSARGHFTVFAPTNEAIAAYLREQVDEGLCTEPSWDAFVTEQKADSVRRVVVMNSIIDGGDNDTDVFGTGDFPLTDRAEFPLSNINDKRLSVRYGSEPGDVYINGDCPVSATERDIPALNGVIHQVGRVIAPTDLTAAGYIMDALERGREGYLVMFRAIQACGLLDTLGVARDEVYERLYLTGRIRDLPNAGSYGFEVGGDAHAPRHRLVGFTILAEPDSFWRGEGLDPHAPDLLEKLTRWIQDKHQYAEGDDFTTGTDYASSRSLLYQWTTYHILPERLPADKLVNHRNERGYDVKAAPYRYTVPVYELYATMGKRRLLKLYESKASEGVYVNRFPNLDDGRRGTGFELSCDPDKTGARVGADSPDAVLNDIENCCIYPLDAPIAYSDRTRDNFQHQRLRFDIMSLFPECMNNNMRLVHSSEERYQQVYIPNTGNEYDYFRDLRMSDVTRCIYMNWWGFTWANLNVDEIKIAGRYEVTLTLPPVPRRGVYEFRYKVLATLARGVVQFYFGTDPERLPVTGIPVDLSKYVTDPMSGSNWEEDTEDDEYNAEIDKRMRNNGFMKDGVSMGDTYSCRDVANNSRRIIWRGVMDPDKTYYVKLKSVIDSEGKEGYLDYFELCPKEVYDNPERPEDIL